MTVTETNVEEQVVRRKLIHVPARIATSARKMASSPRSLALANSRQGLFEHLYPPPQPA
ncbi:hypothetical protein ACVWZ8_004705 [Arthrobacter sp. UYCu723]